MVLNQRPWTLLLSWSSCNGSSIIMIMVVVMMVVIAVVLLYHEFGDGDSVLIKIIMPLQCDLDNTKKQSYVIVLEYHFRID